MKILHPSAVRFLYTEYELKVFFVWYVDFDWFQKYPDRNVFETRCPRKDFSFNLMFNQGSFHYNFECVDM